MTHRTEVNMREKRDDLHLELLSGLSGPEKDSFKAGLRAVGYRDPEARSALKASFKQTFLDQGMDDATADQAADIATEGR